MIAWIGSQLRGTMYDVWGLKLILPVAEIHLLVWTESDRRALLIYAETCMSTGSLKLSGSGLFLNLEKADWVNALAQ